jgi:RING finger protein 113A
MGLDPLTPPRRPPPRSARREAVLKQGTEGAEAAGNADGKYKGMNSYVDYRAGFRREHTVGSEKGTGSHGPLRASVVIRTSAR